VLESAELVALVASTDLARSRAFYEETLGLPCEDETPLACVFRANGTMLRVTRVEARAPAAYTVLGWIVDDVAATVRGLAARGVAFDRYEGMEQDELGIWRSPSGARVAWFHDPDGNTLSLTQRA
jgi:catechol 2,3-dioxygenase-like lactoylglutathione lyase family enzyme